MGRANQDYHNIQRQFALISLTSMSPAGDKLIVAYNSGNATLSKLKKVERTHFRAEKQKKRNETRIRI